MLQPEERADVTHIFSGICADSAHTLWEILGRARSFAQPQRSEEKAHDRRDEHALLLKSTEPKHCRETEEGPQLFTAQTFPPHTHGDVTSLGSKSRFSRGKHFL